MGKYLSKEERYSNDPLFHDLVDSLCFAITKGDYTPTEIREAALLAQIKYEMTHTRLVFNGKPVKGEEK